MKEESVDGMGEHSELTYTGSDHASCSSVAESSSTAENSNRYGA